MIRTLAVLLTGSGLLAIFCMTLMQYFGYAFDYYFAWLVPGSVLFGAGCGMALTSRRGEQQGSSESPSSGQHWMAATAMAGVCSLLAVLYLPLGPVYNFILLMAAISLPYSAWAGWVKILVGENSGRGAWLITAVTAGAVAGLLAAPAILDFAGGPIRTAWIMSALLSLVVLAGASRHSVAISALAALMVVCLSVYQVNATQYSLPRWQPGSTYLAKPILGALSAASNMSARPLQWDSHARSDVLASLTKKNSHDWVITNGTAPVPLVSDVQSLPWLKERFPLVAVPILAGQVQRMLSVSPLPGPDMLIARQLKIPVIDSHVYNSLGESINLEAQGFAGYPAFKTPGLMTGPRSATVGGGRRYDLVFLPITHPANAEWIGSNAVETHLYTREAIRDYWSQLSEGGVLAVTTRDELLFVRMALTLWNMLEVQDPLRGRDFVKQAWGIRLLPLAPYKGSYQFLLMAVKGAAVGPLSQQIRSVIGQLPVEIIFGPGSKSAQPYDLLERSESSQAGIENFTRLFSRRLQKHVDLVSATDRRPYFFHVIRDAHPYMKWLLTACLCILVPVWLFPLADRRRPGLQDAGTHPPLPVLLGNIGLISSLLVMVGGVLANQAGQWALPPVAGASVLSAAIIAGLGLSKVLFIKGSGNWAPVLLTVIIVLIYPLSGLGGEVEAGLYSVPHIGLLVVLSLLLGVSAGVSTLLGMWHTVDAGLNDLLPWVCLVAGVSALAGSVLAYWLSMLWGWHYVWGVSVAASLLVFIMGVWTRKWLESPLDT